MDRHEATTAFVGAGASPTVAETLGQAVELLSGVPAARFLVEYETIAIDNESVADLNFTASAEDPPLLEEVTDVEEADVSEPAPPKSKKK